MQAEVVRAQAQREKGQIHCCDEMDLRSDHQAGCCEGSCGMEVAHPHLSVLELW